MSKKETHYLFVYGTLCQRAIDSKHEYMLPEASFVSEASLQAKLYLIDYYPAVIDSENETDQVRGELYKFTETKTLFAKLDAYEGCTEEHPQPYEYRREKRRVRCTNGDLVEAWIYIFNLPIEEFICIESGDFPSYQEFIYGEPSSS